VAHHHFSTVLLAILLTDSFLTIKRGKCHKEIVMNVIIGSVLGLILFVAMAIFALLATLAVLPLFKKVLMQDPNVKGLIAVFTAPKPGQASIIMRGGRVEHDIHGDTKNIAEGNDKTFGNWFLRAYDKYSFMFGIRFIGIPGIHSVYTQDLPRYRKIEEGGKLTYVAVKTDDPSRRTDHFRTQLTPWFNEFGSVDIEGVPFDVKCATNYRLDPKKINEVAFGIESWNVLLDQTLNAVVRSTIREFVSIDEAIGKISTDIFIDNIGTRASREKEVQGAILKRLLSYRLKDGGVTLTEMGIIIEGFEILDFAPESLTEAELIKLRSPALARRAAQGRVMEGKAEAAYQAEILEVLSKHPELAKVNVNAEAFVRAAKAGTLDALAAALLKNIAK